MFTHNSREKGGKKQKNPQKPSNINNFLILFCFFIFTITPVHADPNQLKTDLLESFYNYEESIFENYASIEFIDTLEYKKVANDVCITHYIKTAHYKIDLIKKRIFIKILFFYLLDGKNEKNRYAGMEREQPLKELYLFTEYIEKKWEDTYINEEETYVSFRGSKWLIPLFVNFQYDKETYFPKQISVASEDKNIEVSMYYSKHSGIYLIDELTSELFLNFIVVNYYITGHITRTNYVLTRRNDTYMDK